jgi:hypothetical protein
MDPLAAIYHPGGGDPNSYPISVIHFQTTWSDEVGAVTEVVCVATDGSIRVFDAQLVQIVDRSVAEAIVNATSAAEKQRRQFGTLPPR